jgi:acyl-CoA reductase-like NAD-dependent aldehyde dehydrogenase
MTARIPVAKTYKLYIRNQFVRSESQRTYGAEGHNVVRASGKDVRDAVVAARAGLSSWSRATPYNRGQVLYRVAEMMEARRSHFEACSSGAAEVDRSIDRWISYAGWADKLVQVVGGANAVSGPYFNFTVPEPMGVVGIVAPSSPALLGLTSRLAAVVVGGNTAVVIASEERPRAAIELAEALATADLPAGVVNIVTGHRRELAPVVAAHMDVNALDVAGSSVDERQELEQHAALNVKRVVSGRADSEGPWEAAAFLELKTVWHPIGA